jgi:Tfp pilus assembly protein PilN
MIEINLVPRAEKRKKRAAGSGFSFKLPSAPKGDRLTTFLVAAWIIGPLLLAWMFFGVRSERSSLQASIDQAVADSARYARLIETQASLQARQDTIAQKLFVIQEIDAGRFVWPHILDEISRAMPPYTWLRTIAHRDAGAEPGFTITGRTGTLPALTRFMDALEASPFLRNIQLVGSEQARLSNDDDRVINDFILTGNYQHPPLEMIETVPLFVDGRAPDGER